MSRGNFDAEQLIEGEFWRGDGEDPTTAGEDPQSWFWTIADWGHPWPVSCVVCGRDAKHPVAVKVAGGEVLFGACSSAHEQQHTANVLRRASQC
ncbi:MAG: hypothetical protein OJF49_004489 [Ktedonobacterales bacterium]|jgi:hypothetical protein|nr:MAG: hypothetical protein OJF49_004489 [Ktedonobacterales bacterium]